MGAIVAVVVVVLIVVVGVAAVISSRSDSSEVASGDSSTTAAETDPLGPPPTAPGPSSRPSTTPSTAPTASPTTAPPTTRVPPTAAPAPPPSSGVPSGLFCRDLAARGLSYPEAVAYWNQEGQPDRMDEDLNGIPCETVYSAGEIGAIFEDDPGGLPSGLFCRDLAARGLSYPEAVAYWNQEGKPDRMDEDLNGIPCETVYSSDEIRSVFG